MSDQLDIEDVAPVTPNGRGGISAMAQAAMHARRDEEVREYDLQSTMTDQINAAIFEVQKALGPVIGMDSKGNHNKYTSLPALLKACKPKLFEQAVLLRQGTGRTHARNVNGVTYLALEVYSRFVHVPSGQHMSEWMEVPFTKIDPQAAMSALTYGKRATLRSILGVADGEGDDDGAGAASVPLEGKMDIHPVARKHIAAMGKMKTPDDLKDWGIKNSETMGSLPDIAAVQCRNAYQAQMQELETVADKQVKK